MPGTQGTVEPTGEHSAPSRSERWHSLDVLKGLALWAMVAHHFQEWTGGEVHGRFLGFERFVVTDLAPPLFAVALGAAAAVVGDRCSRSSRLTQAARRWLQILAIGVALDAATHHTRISGRGVLPTLAILGLTITVGVAVGIRQQWAWWGIAAVSAVLAVPATEITGDDPLRLLINGPFALPVYGVFATAGAAVAVRGIGRSERELPLVRAAAGVLVVGLAGGLLAQGAVAPEGLWPPARYPGHLAYTLWALVSSLVIWALARRLLPAGRALGAAVGRAGHRTLLVFTLHFGVRILLDALGVVGRLDTWRWGLVSWAAVVVCCAASTIRVPGRSTRVRSPSPNIVT